MGSLKLSKIFENSNKNLSEKLKEFSSFIENEEKTYRKRRDKYHESREGREHVRGGTFKLFLFFFLEIDGILMGENFFPLLLLLKEEFFENFGFALSVEPPSECPSIQYVIRQIPKST